MKLRIWTRSGSRSVSFSSYFKPTSLETSREPEMTLTREASTKMIIFAEQTSSPGAVLNQRSLPYTPSSARTNHTFYDKTTRRPPLPTGLAHVNVLFTQCLVLEGSEPRSTQCLEHWAFKH